MPYDDQGSAQIITTEAIEAQRTENIGRYLNQIKALKDEILGLKAAKETLIQEVDAAEGARESALYEARKQSTALEGEHKKIQTMQSEHRNALRAEVLSLSAEKSKLRDEVAALKASLESLQRAIEAANNRVNEINAQIAKLDSVIAEKNSAIDAAEVKLSELKSRINAEYLAQMEDYNSVDRLLKERAQEVDQREEEVAAGESRLAALSEALDVRQKQIIDLEAAQAALREQQAALDKDRAALKDLNDQLEILKGSLALQEIVLNRQKADQQKTQRMIEEAKKALISQGEAHV